MTEITYTHDLNKYSLNVVLELLPASVRVTLIILHLAIVMDQFRGPNA